MNLETHPDENLLHEYVDGELPEDARAGVEAHLLICEECKRQLQQIQELFVTLQRIPQPELESDLVASVLHRIQPRSKAQPLSPYHFKTRTGLAMGLQILTSLALITTVLSIFGSEWTQAFALPEARGILTKLALQINAISMSARSLLTSSSIYLSQWLTNVLQPSVPSLPVTGVAIFAITAAIIWLAGNGLLFHQEAARKK